MTSVDPLTFNPVDDSCVTYVRCAVVQIYVFQSYCADIAFLFQPRILANYFNLEFSFTYSLRILKKFFTLNISRFFILSLFQTD